MEDDAVDKEPLDFADLVGGFAGEVDPIADELDYMDDLGDDAVIDEVQ